LTILATWRFDDLAACYNSSRMTAKQIIKEIAALPPEEQEEVVRFAYNLDAERQLTGRELSALGGRMAASTDPVQKMILREEITRGFYGGKPHA